MTHKKSTRKVFLDRAYDIDVADPTYYTKYERYLNQKAFYENENATIPDYDLLPERKAVRPEYDDVFEDSNWWVLPPLDIVIVRISHLRVLLAYTRRVNTMTSQSIIFLPRKNRCELFVNGVF